MHYQKIPILIVYIQPHKKALVATKRELSKKKSKNVQVQAHPVPEKLSMQHKINMSQEFWQIQVKSLF